MQEDFHYYATYCAAYLAGYSHNECMDICHSAQLVDLCSKTFLAELKAPLSAATTQLQLELMKSPRDRVGLQDITRIWASFHFLPRDLYAQKERCSKSYLNKYRLICGANGELVKDTVRLAENAGPEAVGIAMHILADTWAHSNFAGTPSLVINNTNYHFFELSDDGEKRIEFRHSPFMPDEPENCLYTASVYQNSEISIMNLGHGRAGHLPDYSYIRYKYMPAWGEYNEIIKDNPSDYYNAFCQMIYAMKYLRGDYEEFETDRYAFDCVEDRKDEICSILRKRRIDSSDDWKRFGESLSGQDIEKFDPNKHTAEYLNATNVGKANTFLGRFITAALAQKSMVTNKIHKSGNKLAGFSIDYDKKGFRGIKDYRQLIYRKRKEIVK